MLRPGQRVHQSGRLPDLARILERMIGVPSAASG